MLSTTTLATKPLSNRDSVNHDDSSFDSDMLERDSGEQESSSSSSSSEDTHLDECDICGDGGELICCDGCEKTYHGECLGVDVNALPEVWYGPCCDKRLPIKRQSAVFPSAQTGVKSTADMKADDRAEGPEDGLGLVAAGKDSTSHNATYDATEPRVAAKKSDESASLIPEPTKKIVTEQSDVDRSRHAEVQCCQLVANSVGHPQFTDNSKYATTHTSPLADNNILSKQLEQHSVSTATHQPMNGSISSVKYNSCDKCQLIYTHHTPCACTTTVNKAKSHPQSNRSTVHDATTRRTHQKSSTRSTFRTVVVPQGVVEGSIFHVIMENAQRMGVICPRGVQPGQTMIVLEPGVDVAPISPETIVDMNEARLVEGFDRRDAEFVRRAFWKTLFPRLQESGWFFTRETNYNFGAYRFYASENSNKNNSNHRMETIADILKFVESNGCMGEEVQEFHRHVERQKQEARRGSDRKRKWSQDAGLTKEEKRILDGGKRQVRSLPRCGSNEPSSSKEYIQEQIWSRDEASQKACTFLESLPHSCREEAFCSLHTVRYDPAAAAPSHTINANKEKFKRNKWAEDPSFAADFHNAIMKCKKEMHAVSSTLEKPIGFCLWYYYSKYKPSDNYAALKRHMKVLQMQESRNQSKCAICEGGGELLCCDTCSNAYHLKCLGFSDMTAFDDKDSWSCPVCVRKRKERCRSPAKPPKKVLRIDRSPQEISFQGNDTNAIAQPRRSSEIESCMLPPKTLHPFGLPADSSTAETVLQREARKSDPSAEIEASCRDFGRPTATNGPVNPIQNASTLFSNRACNMPYHFSVYSAQNCTHIRFEEQSKVKYDYGDRYSLQNIAARKQEDGTVLPISLKRLPNGEYARPIGRQRKGMQWDGLCGVWVPIH
ncbi:hypothetical protein ACHAW6_007364 [Cyclotella cf. meneghiniana]